MQVRVAFGRKPERQVFSWRGSYVTVDTASVQVVVNYKMQTTQVASPLTFAEPNAIDALFVGFVVLQPSQPIKVMASMVSWSVNLSTLFLGMLPKQLTSTKCPYFCQ